MAPRPLALLAALTTALTLCAPLSARAGAGAAPDLGVAGGRVSLQDGKAVGRFTVVNRGNRRSPATKAKVRVGRHGRTYSVPSLAPGERRKVRFAMRAGQGRKRVAVCVDSRRRVAETRERDNCRRIGRVGSGGGTFPSQPMRFEPGQVFRVGRSPREYWLHVPTTYPRNHRTATRLVVFLHGCGGSGEAQGNDIKWNVPGVGSAPYIVMTPGLGRDGQCWDAQGDVTPVLRAIRDVRTHFNIAPRRTVIGGYSSGSTLAGFTAFAHAGKFAGLLTMMGRPWWSEDQRDQMLDDAAWKLNLAWRAHTGDEYYDIGPLRGDRSALLGRGYPLTFSEIAGSHAYTADDLAWVFGRIDPSWKVG